MSMSHKAFLFDWTAFQHDLAPFLIASLKDGQTERLIEFGNQNLELIRDPYEGEELESDWFRQLDVGDVQEIADHVLTKYYNPKEDGGLGEVWKEIEGSLDDVQRSALLGYPLGWSEAALFDPGKMGSYFQDEKRAKASLKCLETLDRPELGPFLATLRRAVETKKGLYVTF